MKRECLRAVILFGLGASAAASVASNDTTAAGATQATVAIPAGTVIGAVADGVEYFRGIPYAQPPTGPLRLNPPVRVNGSFGTVDATGLGPACPQMSFPPEPPLFYEAISDPAVAQALFLGGATGDVTEDCLTVSVMRPQGTPHDAKLPVLFWIFGGGFQIGSAQPYNGSVLIPRAVASGQPFILVAVNYRLGGFGFLGGREVQAAGVANLGLLDQRMALEWVADNVAAFGGNPDAVTLWGESAGAISAFSQMALFDGNNKYKGRALFHGAIMHSGSILPADVVDGPKAQAVFDSVYDYVAAKGVCGSKASTGSASAEVDKLACLREADFETFLNATNSVPIFMSYNALALSYLPRPDGRSLTASPDELARTGKYAAVPAIVGFMEDEGAIFSVFQANLTTEADLLTYLGSNNFPHATPAQVAGLVAHYPWDNGTAGSPWGTGTANVAYPQFKRLAAITGDSFIILMPRRTLLASLTSHGTPAWSFMATWAHGTRLLGTFHTSDLPRTFYGQDKASQAIQDRIIAFVSSQDPNQRAAGNAAAATAGGFDTYWPMWRHGNKLMTFGANGTSLQVDNFREDSFEYFRANMAAWRE